MAPSPARELPAELLERIFRVRKPYGLPEETLIDDKQRLRCQLVCKGWRRALAPERWPLLQLDLCADTPDEVPALALWIQHMRAGVRRLNILLGVPNDTVPLADWDWEHAGRRIPAVDEVHAALEALQPCSALCSLRITAPFCALFYLLFPKLESFTGLRQLQLEAQPEDRGDIDDEWDMEATLTPDMVRQLPPQLESLTVIKFDLVQLATHYDFEAEGSAGGSAAEPPSPLLPALTHLHIKDVNELKINMPLPSLAELSAEIALSVSLAGPECHLPQLTSLSLRYAINGATLRCAALPALARLHTTDAVTASDSFSALRSWTQLELTWEHESHPEHADLLRGVSSSLRSLSWYVMGPDEFEHQAVEMAAGAQLTRLTELEFRTTACINHLPAWPKLQALLLCGASPTDVEPQQLALLEASPCLRRLAFGSRFSRHDSQQMHRLQELQRALPQCWVQRY